MVVMEDKAMTPQAIKEYEQQAQQEFIERTQGQDVDVVLHPKRPEIKVPIKVAVRKDVQISDLPAVWLFAFGNMTTEEYNKYLAENAGNLTINEITASKVLEGVMKDNREDKAIYWRLQEKILAKPSAVAGKQSITDLKPNAIMSKLLDEIEAKVFGEASEAEVIEPDKGIADKPSQA